MFKRLLSKYLLVWLVLVCVLGFYWSKVLGLDSALYACTGRVVGNPFLLTGDQMAWLISLTMLAVGSLLPFEEIKEVAHSWPKILGGTCVQYVAMPTLAFLAAILFKLQGGYFIGLMMAGCVPGAMASNVLTLTARGNVSYSVGLTTSATLLSPLVVPASLYLFFHGTSFSIDFQRMMINLLLTVVLPVVLGFTLSRLFSWWQKGADRIAEVVANIVIIWLIAAVVTKTGSAILKLTPAAIAGILALNFCGLFAGYFGGKLLKLTPAMRRALTIEVGMQNAGLGTALATLYFADVPEAALMCAAYTFECMATGIVVAKVFRYVATREEEKQKNLASASASAGKAA